MKNKSKVLLTFLTVLSVLTISTACNSLFDNSGSSNSNSSDTSSDEVVNEYTVTFEGAEVAAQTVKEGETASKPAAPVGYKGEDGYNYVFENWYVKDTETVYDFETAVEENVTLVAKYTKGAAIEYTVTFVDENDQAVGTATYTVENKEITEPAVPAKDGYTVAWPVYELVMGDVTVKANYTAIEYTLSFTHPKTGMVLAAPMTYTMDNVSTLVFPEVPADLAMEGYTVSWNKTPADVMAGGCDVNPAWTAIEYTLSFTHPKTGMVLAAPITYTIENMRELVFPEVPADLAMEGYTVSWNKTAEDVTIGGCDVNPVWTANTYTITYDAKGGTIESETQEVVYGEEYTLATATASKVYQEFVGWVDEEGNAVVSGESWAIADDVTLTAVYSNTMTFEKATAVPTGLKSGNQAGTATIGEKDGDKCLVVPVTGSTPYLLVTRTFLAEFFEDPNVAYLAFDAKTETLTTDNFRRYTMKADGSGMHYVWYEAQHDITEFATADGVSSESWKSFYFSREDYNHWVTNNIEEQTLIYATGFKAGDKIYVDNIRPVTAQEYLDGQYGFETGWVRLNGTNLLAYNSLGTLRQWQLGIGFNSNANAPTAYGLTNERASNGGRALSFTKPAGNIADYFVRLNDGAFAAMKSTGYYAFDLYIPEGADTTLISKDTNYAIAQPKAGAWTTVYVSSTNNQPVLIRDTTGGTYAIDYFRSVTEEEFNAAMYGFEPGAGELRDITETENRLYYYAGADAHTTKKVSLNVKGDSAAIGNVRLDTEIVHSGDYALAFEKTEGYAYMSMSPESMMYADLKDGFTFWIYSTVALNGTGDTENFVNGNTEQFGDEGMLIPANTWVQVTITADDIANGRFLIIQGSTAGTIYLDDFCPLPKSAE